MCKGWSYYGVYSVLHGGVVQADGHRQEWFLVSFSGAFWLSQSLQSVQCVSDLKTSLPTAQLHSLPLFPFYCKLVKVLKKENKYIYKIKNSWGICVNSFISKDKAIVIHNITWIIVQLLLFYLYSFLCFIKKKGNRGSNLLTHANINGNTV